MRPPRSGLILVAVASASCLLAGGCGSSGTPPQISEAGRSPVAAASSQPVAATTTSGKNNSPCPATALTVKQMHTGLPGASGEDGYAQFEVSTTQSNACTISGYPTVGLDDSAKKPIEFKYRHGGGPYVTSHPPAEVSLLGPTPAYFIVTKYRCDVRHAATAAWLRLRLPGYTRVWTFNLPGLPGGFDYCQGIGEPDPGNTVTVSPVEATFAATLP